MQRRVGVVLVGLAACKPAEPPAPPAEEPGTTPSSSDPDPVEPAPTEPPGPTTTTPPPAAPVWIAFSGGGYYAHSAHTGMMMGMLEASGLDLIELTANVVGVSSNSGGTWFTTQLAYAEPFRAALEAEPDAWATTGYLGQTEDLFAFDDACVGYGSPLSDICENAPSLHPIFAMGKISGVPTLDWHEIVGNTVYAPFGMTEAMAVATLDGPREAWADGKTLVFATTVLTDDVVLEEEPGFLALKDFYVATPTLAGVPPQENFAPAAFASAGADGIRPRFLLPGPLGIEHTNNEPFGADSLHTVVLDDPSTNLSIVSAASASSALGAAAVSRGVLDESGISDPIPLTNDEIAYQVRGWAPAFSVLDGAVTRLDPVPTSMEAQSALGAVRVGDGGWADDTAVAVAVRALADRGMPEDFTILSLLAARAAPGQRGAVPLPFEFERLFTGGEVSADGVAELCVSEGICAGAMSPAVFDGAALDTAVVRWSYVEGDVSITHVELQVVTVDNPTYGVTAGHSGVVHVLITTVIDAPVIPIDDASFDLWADTVDAARSGVTDGGGWDVLGEVLGAR